MNEVTEKDEASLQEFHELINQSENVLMQKGVLEGYITDDDLIIAIRTREYDVQSAFQRYSSMYKNRVENYPEIFVKLIPSYLEGGFGNGGVQVLKRKDPLGRTVLIAKARAWDPSVYSADEALLGLLLMAQEALLQSKDAQLNGICFIFDISGAGWKHVRCLTPQFLRKWIKMVKSGAVKVKGLYVVNFMPVFRPIFTITKALLPVKIFGRLHCFGTPTEGFLSECLPSEILPQSLGGLLTEEEAIDNEFNTTLFNRENYYINLAMPCKISLKQNGQIH